MSFPVYRINDKIHHGIEKAILNIESFHLRMMSKPYDFIEKAAPLRPIVQSIRQVTEALIGKSYRGVRDLNEMSHQVSENYLSVTGWKH
jgi:hypothetical protein